MEFVLRYLEGGRMASPRSVPNPDPPVWREEEFPTYEAALERTRELIDRPWIKQLQLLRGTDRTVLLDPRQLAEMVGKRLSPQG